MAEQDCVLGVRAAVALQGKPLKAKKLAQHHAWRFEDGAYVEVVWDQYKAGLGNTVVVQTGPRTLHPPLPARMHACTLPPASARPA